LEGSRGRRSRRLEWLLVTVLAAGSLWRIGSLDAMLRAAVVALAATFAATLFGVVSCSPTGVGGPRRQPAKGF
jgi:hypothetical protein